MRVTRDPYHPGITRRSVVAIGVFDGVHRAHRVIISSAVAFARRTGATSVVLTFWPHPQGQQSLYSLEHRIRIIAALGADVCVVARFDRRFARMAAAAFIKEILVDALRASAVYVGENFRFGKDARGDSALLQKYSAQFHYALKIFRVLKSHRRVISSTAIRRLIVEGKLYEAASLLEHPVSILGRVGRGDSLATRLGFPTANIDPQHDIVPPAGIYAVRIVWKGRQFKGVCYIGNRPTFKARNAERSIEVHIFDFHRRIYGQPLEIAFVKKIRNERKFSSTPALIKAIKKDIISAKKIFSLH
jgi:riboflavin kinase/FMN adenylyltransferase